jgi:hypothetical protein
VTTESNELKSQGRESTLKLLHALSGIVEGLVNSAGLNKFIDWFHPAYFNRVVESTLNTFHEDDEVVHTLFKFLREIVYNRNSRLRFEMWNVNGLIVFKESAKYIIKMLDVWRYLSQSTNSYIGKWKKVKEVLLFFKNVI